MLVLYITYIDLGETDIGSKLRPYKMYKAFLDLNYKVKILSSAQTIKNKKNRLAKINEINNWLISNKPDFCYIESDYTAIRFRDDYRLIKQLKKLNIPTAYFYRDFDYKFKDMKINVRGIINNLREIYIKLLWLKTNSILKNISIVYFPSKYCFKYFNFKNMKALPPAGEVAPYKQTSSKKTCIYVGGLSERYGTNLLLESFKRLNKNSNTFKLILVCREDDYIKYKDEFDSFNWVEVHHVSGKELTKLYAEANIALIPLKHTNYNDLAISVKLFEYMSYGLPIIATSNQAMKEIILDANCGITTNDDVISYSNAINDIFNDDVKLQKFSENALLALENKHTWKNRALQVTKDIAQIKLD